MVKDMDEWTRIIEEKRNEERTKLLAINDEDAKKLSHADQYMRWKYQGEIESAKWLAELRRTLPLAKSEPTKQKASFYQKNKSNTPWTD